MLPTDLRTKAELLTACGGSPVVRAEAPGQLVAPALLLRDGPSWAVAFHRPTHLRGVSLMVHAGDDGRDASPPSDRAIDLLDELVRSSPFASWLADARAAGATAISLPRASVARLGHLLADGEHEVGRWEWMSTCEAPAAAAAPVLDLGPATAEEITDVLTRFNARTDGRPFAHPGQRWVGVRDDGGRLVSVGCCEIEVSGTPILTGITTEGPARGRGLGRAVTAELTRGAVAEHGWSTLGMYSDNDVARQLYVDLGYRLGARWTSGALAGAAPLSGPRCR